ncbi:MAG: hypothetical protein Q4P24_14770, partial [Rhodobacterales bacterium]|nr:hypothetical protein [Rhodobacterales bacterium]
IRAFPKVGGITPSGGTLSTSHGTPRHPDHALLGALRKDITQRAGRATALPSIGVLLRGRMDRDHDHSNWWAQLWRLGKDGKTCIGTRVEIELCALLVLSKGWLETVIFRYESNDELGGNG